MYARSARCELPKCSATREKRHKGAAARRCANSLAGRAGVSGCDWKGWGVGIRLEGLWACRAAAEQLKSRAFGQVGRRSREPSGTDHAGPRLMASEGQPCRALPAGRLFAQGADGVCRDTEVSIGVQAVNARVRDQRNAMHAFLAALGQPAAQDVHHAAGNVVELVKAPC